MSKPSPEMFRAGAEAVEEITKSMLMAAGEALMRHGNDPASEAILAAAVAMFVDKIDTTISVGFKRKMIMLLSETKP